MLDVGEGCYVLTAMTIDVPWIRVPDTYGGGQYLNVFVDANPGAQRTGHITLSGNGVYMQITIVQAGS